MVKIDLSYWKSKLNAGAISFFPVSSYSRETPVFGALA
jgi:hypothetical protein